MNNEIFEIIGGNKLFGTIKNQTSKNATLPIMSASLLCDGEVTLYDIPDITDVHNMINILNKLGVKTTFEDGKLNINSSEIKESTIDCELSKTMRSSLFLLGSMLSRFGEVDLTLPGGCKIGTRPINLHIKAFKRLGVEIEEFENHVVFNAKHIKPKRIKLKIPSVGATENIVQFACKLKGKTTIINAAKEPEVIDLCNFLNQMGAKILGAGTSKITIYGVDKLLTTEYKPIGDRIVAGTIAVAVAIAGGDVTITNAVPYQNLKLIEILQQIGCQIDFKNDILRITRNGGLLAPVNISTGFYPDFPTDLQSQMLVLSSLLNGKAKIKENIFENRFLIVQELLKMGANIKLKDSNIAKIKGVSKLNASDLTAKDLRGGAALVLAGLVANGKSTIKDIHYIDRGYDHIEEMFSSLGATIKRVCQKEV